MNGTKKYQAFLCNFIMSLSVINASDGYNRYENFNKYLELKIHNADLTLASLNYIKNKTSQDNNESNGVFTYMPARDRHAVHLMFEEYENNLTSRSPDAMGSSKVLRKANETVGFINFSMLTNLAEGSLNALVVGRKYHRKGYAQELLGYSFDEMRKNDIAKIKLSVRVGNKNARKLYEKMGFKAMPHRWFDNESLEKNPNDWVEMLKEI